MFSEAFVARGQFEDNNLPWPRRCAVSECFSLLLLSSSSSLVVLLLNIMIIFFFFFPQITVYVMLVPLPAFLYAFPRGQTQDQAERTRIDSTPKPSEISLHSSQTATSRSVRSGDHCRRTWKIVDNDLINKPINMAICDTSCTKCTDTWGDDYWCQPKMRAQFVQRRHKWHCGNNVTYSKWYLSIVVFPEDCVCVSKMTELNLNYLW